MPLWGRKTLFIWSPCSQSQKQCCFTWTLRQVLQVESTGHLLPKAWMPHGWDSTASHWSFQAGGFSQSALDLLTPAFPHWKGTWLNATHLLPVDGCWLLVWVLMTVQGIGPNLYLLTSWLPSPTPVVFFLALDPSSKWSYGVSSWAFSIIPQVGFSFAHCGLADLSLNLILAWLSVLQN